MSDATIVILCDAKGCEIVFDRGAESVVIKGEVERLWRLADDLCKRLHDAEPEGD